MKSDRVSIDQPLETKQSPVSLHACWSLWLAAAEQEKHVDRGVHPQEHEQESSYDDVGTLEGEKTEKLPEQVSPWKTWWRRKTQQGGRKATPSKQSNEDDDGGGKE